MVEILTTIFIVLIASFILYNNFKKKSKGDCGCGNCSSKCPRYQKKEKS